MKIFIGADHRGFQLKQKLIPWLKEQGHEVVDCGNTTYNPEDSYVEFAKTVAEKVTKPAAQGDSSVASLSQNDKIFGIIICGSGIGVSVVANRHKGVRCALGFDIEQIKHGRENDHINCLSIPAEFMDEQTAKEMITTLLTTRPKMEEKYLRRVQKMDL